MASVASAVIMASQGTDVIIARFGQQQGRICWLQTLEEELADFNYWVKAVLLNG